MAIVHKTTRQIIILFLALLLVGSISTGILEQANAAVTLSVTVTTFQGNVSTTYDFLVVEATVMANGSPVSGASVSFTDTRSSTFIGTPAITNASGVGIATVQFTNGWNAGNDIISASATLSGYNTGTGSSIVTLMQGNSTQLYVTPSFTNKAASGGSTNVISGTVATQSGNVNGATVTFSDALRSSFSSTTVTTNSNGFFSTNFTMASIAYSAADLVTVTAANNGYISSQSTIILQVNAFNSNDLTVQMNTFYPSTTSTVYDYMIVEATVTAGGLPVSGASISFSDGRSSAFTPQTANTNASGIAVTTVQFNNGWGGGIDTLIGSATSSGYNQGVGSNNVFIRGAAARNSTLRLRLQTR